MFRITKDFAFSYSHRLAHLPVGHQCHRLHGHNAVVRIVLESETLVDGFVIDYGDLAPLKGWLDSTFDHQHLNDVVAFPPTAELLAQEVARWCAAHTDWPVAAVGWSETPKTWAWWVLS